MGANDTQHLVTLGYTTDDDGVHIQCICGWDHNLGYSPTATEASALSEAHSWTPTRGSFDRLQAVAEASYGRACFACDDHCLSAAKHGHTIPIRVCDAGKLRLALQALHDDDLPNDDEPCQLGVQLKGDTIDLGSPTP